MKIVIHNLSNDTSQSYDGDVATIERDLEKDFGWALSGNEGDLDQILWVIDHHPYFGVEIADKSLHPFLQT
jgi:hypothetical protein